MQNKTLEAQIKEVGERLKVLDRGIAENASAATKAETRLEQARKRLSALTAAKEEARAKRGDAAAAGEDVSALSKQLREVDEEMGLREDEIRGLTSRIEQLATEGASLKLERLAKAREIPMAEQRADGRLYNAIAEQLAPVLERMTARLSQAGKVVQFPGGLPSSIPRAFVTGDAEFIDVGNPEKHFIFDGTGMKEKRAQRVRPLTIAEEVAS